MISHFLVEHVFLVTVYTLERERERERGRERYPKWQYNWNIG